MANYYTAVDEFLLLFKHQQRCSNRESFTHKLLNRCFDHIGSTCVIVTREFQELFVQLLTRWKALNIKCWIIQQLTIFKSSASLLCNSPNIKRNFHHYTDRKVIDIKETIDHKQQPSLKYNFDHVNTLESLL